ncbi:uncharacterized protein LOC135400132 [Ornithodoros turicata]|uniref:uncharacterized protein LOC135400132 n=1 Tax=Ornithodoros turicata TaxID=34597 RepID=UPI00313A2385
MKAAILMWIFCGWLGCPMCFGQEPSLKPQPGAKSRVVRSSYIEVPLRPPDFQYSSQRNLPFGPRRHRFMHFGKREYLPPFPLHVFTPDPFELGLIAEEDLSSLPRTDDDEEQVGSDYNEIEPGVDKRGRDDTNRFIHFGKRVLYEYNDDGRMKRSVDDVSSEETKRAGNKIMHFGKRPSEDDMFDEDWLDDAEEKRNRIMHFGKRAVDYYKKRNPNRIMHFGKRSPIPYNKKANKIMHFGKRDPETVSLESAFDDLVKRAPNRMMHFGKRTEDGVLKRAPNKIMHFGKRMFDDDDDPIKRASHRIMHFGKRMFDDDEDPIKRASHRIMHFGKRMFDDDDDPMKRASHRIMHFGKRTFDDEDPMKRASHRIMHFGKRLLDEDPDKRASHRIMHFGKRTFDDEDLMKRAPHRIMHFGKRTYDEEDPVKRSSDGVMDFGMGTLNEDNSEKRASHKIMHFGKRQDDEATVQRRKRSVEDEATLQRMVSELIGFDKRQPGGILSPPLQLPHAYVAAHVYRSAIPRMLSRPSRSDRFFPALLGHDASRPRAQTRNVFLHFG